MPLLKFISVFFLAFLVSFFSYSQKKEKIELVRANELTNGRLEGDFLFIGNVIFKQKGTFLYCDSAYFYNSKKAPEKQNSIDAFGHIKIQQGDSITLTGNTLHYEGNSKMAIVKGNVVLKDRKMTLTTDVLNYDMNAGLASYNTGGKIRDENNTVTSQIGVYNTSNKTLYFKKDVRVVNIKEGFNLSGDTLEYNTDNKIVTFRGPTKIVRQESVLYADHGEYNTINKITRVPGKPKVESGDYTLTGDHISYDEVKNVGVVTGNVVMVSSKNKVIIEGDIAHYTPKVSKVFGNTLMKHASGKDTLFMTADTLISIDNENKAQKRILAFNNTKIFRTDLQGKCDSLVYNFSDSTIYFFTDPVLWNEGNQIIADSINIQLANNEISRMNMNLNSFIISEDSIKNYNQVKGKKMTAFFTENKISKVDVKGNGESIYFALEKDTIVVGMNKVECSDIMVKFEDNKLNSISFIKSPDAQFIPPHELQEPDKRLKGFSWRVKERPTRNQVLHLNLINN
jgi:lipopolysaccharide export system protein LptA